MSLSLEVLHQTTHPWDRRAFLISTDESLHRQSRGLLQLKMLNLSQTSLPCPLLTLPFLSRVISRAPGLKLVVETLISSLKPIGNIVLICCAFFIIFGILGVQVGCYCPSSSPCAATLPWAPVALDATTRRRNQAKQDGQVSQEYVCSCPPSLAISHHNICAAFGRASQVLSECRHCWVCEVGGNTPGRNCIRVWVSVIGRAQGWCGTGLTGRVHITPQGQVVHSAPACMNPASSQLCFSPLPLRPKSTHNLFFLIFFLLFNPLYFWLLHCRGARAWALLPSQAMCYT